MRRFRPKGELRGGRGCARYKGLAPGLKGENRGRGVNRVTQNARVPVCSPPRAPGPVFYHWGGGLAVGGG